MEEKTKYYLLKQKAVPEVLLKVAEAKKLIASEKAMTIQEATDQLVPNAEFLTFGGYRYDYSHPEIPHYNLIEVNEIDSLPNGSGPKVFERLANNVADDIKEVLLCHLNSRKLENERV